MKNTDLNLDALENADEEAVGKIAESYTALDKKQRDRIFKISQKKYSEKSNENGVTDHSDGDESSGVEIYSRSKWHRFLAVASSVIVMAGAIAGGVYLLKGMKNAPDDIYSEAGSSETEDESSQTAIAMIGAPFGDISEDKILFMTAAVAPYLIQVPQEAQYKIANALNDSVWEVIDINEPIPPGESTAMYVYNNGEPFNLVFFGDSSVIVSDGINETRYRISHEDFSPIYEAVQSDDIYDDLIWCDVPDVSVTGVWKNVVTERVDYDMSTKEGVYYKMLNTIDYFDKASGKFIRNADELNCTVSEFETNMNLGTAYDRRRNFTLYDIDPVLNGEVDISELADENAVSETIYYNDIEKEYIIYPDTKEYQSYYNSSHRADDNHLSVEERVDECGYDVWKYRTDLTNCPTAKMCLFPQEMTMGYLSNFEAWEIVGTESVLDRECVVLSGKLSGSYSEKVNVCSFVFYIDKETGVTLKYLGYDNFGDISDFIIVDTIAFDSEADNVRSVDLSEYSEITLTNPQ